ncbi:hypothetical protein FRACYDRAFT_254940 [Fragilariopsis cylindrus CCMP1102]|uniref:Uncharacterized protein n=1 Tax=Fragilariopsis cylindrus CCMP1102 TaxID=635003 RepID=A0A1E7EKA2_9STRA|nr:hypothetical protein FRACYDRAFT_254940 [Fragilariopsis cylindrus CCMP1102]|eukprot:OEU06345.1 hypothetical protein FRACYDRAFT_254940 [Fragilariopsis cylindrus CCMP1102]
MKAEIVQQQSNNNNDKNLSMSLLSRRSVVSSIAASITATAITSTVLGGHIIEEAAAATKGKGTLFDENSSSNSDSSSDSDPSIKMIDYNVKDFSISLPNNWNIITKYKQQEEGNDNNKKTTKARNPTLFSAIDFKSGTVVSVVQEEACSINEYAKSSFSSSSSSSKNNNNNKICDFVLTTPTTTPPTSSLLFSNDTYKKDATKLLLRHDDRDNAVLNGISNLDNCQLVSSSKSSSSSSSKSVLELQATTSIPSGGTYVDTMGINQLKMIDRKVVAKAYHYVVDDNPATQYSYDANNEVTGSPIPGSVSRISVISIWLSSPLDEWQNPSMNIKLNQIWDSVTTTTTI